MMRRCSIVFAITLLMASTAAADDIKVLAANAIKEGYAEIVGQFEKSSGHKVTTVFAGTVAASKRVQDGEIFDMVIIGSENIDQLIKSGHLADRVDFAKSGVGMAVRVGVEKPDIGSAEAVKAAVLASKTVAYSAGPSGAYVGELMKRLGLASQIEGRVQQPTSGSEVAVLLQKGEADLGFGQVSEFLSVPGLVNLGPLPTAIQNFTIYAVGVPASLVKSDARQALIAALKAPGAAAAIRKMGMDPG